MTDVICHARLRPYFPKSHGRQRVGDRRVLSGILFVNRNGLRRCDAPEEYGPAKTLYNRWKPWGDKGVFVHIMEGLAAPQASERKTVMIDATYLKAHRTASSLAGKTGEAGPLQKFASVYASFDNHSNQERHLANRKLCMKMRSESFAECRNFAA